MQRYKVNYNSKALSPLTYICNAILNTGTFPDRLKYAIIKPIFKKGDDQDITNYRPIALLTSFSKVIEKLIYARFLFIHSFFIYIP
jgi:hypothetical protein